MKSMKKSLVVFIITTYVGMLLTKKVILNLSKNREAKTPYMLVFETNLINLMTLDFVSSVVGCNQ